MSTALILTNEKALHKKYGSGKSRIFAAVDKLVRTHRKEGITTRVLALDDATAMKAIRANPVTDPASEEENKAAVDAACKRYRPDYILLLGSIDIIPHQALENKIGDFEPFVPSDLPYACKAPFSRKVADFMSPTRIVGRLPDVTGSPGDLKYFLDVLGHAANLREGKPEKSFQDYFALSAPTFDASTRQILSNLFGNLDGMVGCPPESSPWAEARMSKHVHFGNCHGGEYASFFFGATNCTALDAAQVASSKISPGMVATFAGCYGAQLYDPKVAREKVNTTHIAICNTYLQKGCSAYFGSSCLSFGSPQGHLENSSLMTQYFLQHILAGCTSGEACLEARHDYVLNQPHVLEAVSSRALAGFHILGDPTIAPVQLKPDSAGRWKDRAGFRTHLKGKTRERAAEIEARRPAGEEDLAIEPSDAVREQIRGFTEKHGGASPKINSSRVRYSKGFAAAPGADLPTHVHSVCFNVSEEGSFPRFVIYRIEEADGRILRQTEHHSMS